MKADRESQLSLETQHKKHKRSGSACRYEQIIFRRSKGSFIEGSEVGEKDKKIRNFVTF